MVPLTLLDHIKLREGFRAKVYADSLDKATAGWGHLLSAAERAEYPKGAVVPQAVLDQWFHDDTEHAYSVARSQVERIGFNDPRLVAALTSVCFQLGGVWYVRFKRTWAHLLSHEWDAAADEAEKGGGADGKSDWFHQSPVRVKDFQLALRSLDLPQPATFEPIVAAPIVAEPIAVNDSPHS